MWPFTATVKQKEETAAPEPNPNAFIVPDYQRGAPYVQANYVFADNEDITRRYSKHEFETVTEQHRESGYTTYPEAGKPPQTWHGYEDESWQRSQRLEHARGEEGFPIHQWDNRVGARNPYYAPNIVHRPQRSPHEYSFMRPYDTEILGARNLNGEHYSLATLGQSSEPLKGMVAPMHRRSTHRLDPSQLDVTSIATDDDMPGLTFTSPESPEFTSRSYRL